MDRDNAIVGKIHVRSRDGTNPRCQSETRDQAGTFLHLGCVKERSHKSLTWVGHLAFHFLDKEVGER